MILLNAGLLLSRTCGGTNACIGGVDLYTKSNTIVLMIWLHTVYALMCEVLLTGQLAVA